MGFERGSAAACISPTPSESRERRMERKIQWRAAALPHSLALLPKTPFCLGSEPRPCCLPPSPTPLLGVFSCPCFPGVCPPSPTVLLGLNQPPPPPQALCYLSAPTHAGPVSLRAVGTLQREGCLWLRGAPCPGVSPGCAPVQGGGWGPQLHSDSSLSAVMTGSESSQAPGLGAELVRGDLMRAGGRRCLWLFVAAALASACLDCSGVCTGPLAGLILLPPSPPPLPHAVPPSSAPSHPPQVPTLPPMSTMPELIGLGHPDAVFPQPRG